MFKLLIFKHLFQKRTIILIGFWLVIMAVPVTVFYSQKYIEKFSQQVVFSDEDFEQSFENKKGEIVFDDIDYEDYKVVHQTSGESSEEISKIVEDDSVINTMYDGFGNKTETRSFNSNTLVKKVVMRTLANGERQIFVYAQNGEVINLTSDKSDKVLTVPGNEIASLAKIYESREQRDKKRAEIAERKSENLRQTETSEFPTNRENMENSDVYQDRQVKNNQKDTKTENVETEDESTTTDFKRG